MGYHWTYGSDAVAPCLEKCGKFGSAEIKCIQIF